MVDDAETFRRFGYSYHDLKCGSDKPVVTICDDCESERIARRNAIHPRCVHCAPKTPQARETNRRANAKLNESRRGVPRSLETKVKLSKAVKAAWQRRPHPRSGVVLDNDLRRRISEAVRGFKHSGEARQKMSAQRKGKKLSIEHRRKIGQANSGPNSYLYGRPPRNIAPVIYGGTTYRSGWEVKTAQFFERSHIDYRYEHRTFLLGKGLGSYTPDFYLSELDEYVEVKGYWYSGQREKFNQFTEQYPYIKISIWDRPVLKEKQIL